MKEIASPFDGKFRTFGPFGPAYEVLDTLPSKPQKNGMLLRIRILETNEILEYPYNQLANDPEAS